MSPIATAPAGLTGPDQHRRVAYLARVLRTLYPGGEGDRSYLVLPHLGRPRLLVPAGAARAAAEAVRHGLAPGSWPGRLARLAAATALRCGAAGPLLPGRVRVEPAGSIEPHLGRLLGHPVHLGIHIGADRANRKPVLHLIRPDGGSAGFAKLGDNPLTGELVAAEAAALATLARVRLDQLDVPRLQHSGHWRGHRLLVQSTLPAWHRRAAAQPARLVPAMRELAYCLGTTEWPLTSSRYWQALTARVAALGARDPADRSPEASILATAASGLAARAGPVRLRYGSWHGDWAPWNMAVRDGTVLLWDWERFASGVPIGFDALHYYLQRRLPSTSDAAAAVAGTLAAAEALLAPFGVPAAVAPVIGALYLLDLATRYLADRQAEAGARLGVLGSWLLPVLAHHLETLEART